MANGSADTVVMLRSKATKYLAGYPSKQALHG